MMNITLNGMKVMMSSGLKYFDLGGSEIIVPPKDKSFVATYNDFWFYIHIEMVEVGIYMMNKFIENEVHPKIFIKNGKAFTYLSKCVQIDKNPFEPINEEIKHGE